LRTKKWPIRPSVKGKDKERPTDWLQLEQYDHFDAYRVAEIHGLEVLDYVRKASDVSSF